MAVITDVYAREIMDSRGNPTVEVEVYLDEKETYPLAPKKVLEFDGEARISVKALKESDIFVYLVVKR